MPVGVYDRPPLLFRFIEKFYIDDNDCWIWTANLYPDGYGQVKAFGKPQRAHRVSWILFRGEIPEGLQPDHLCRVRNCVNPAHLEWVTCKENIQRGKKGRAMKTHCIRGHLLSGDNLYVPPKRPDRRYCRACQQERTRRG